MKNEKIKNLERSICSGQPVQTHKNSYDTPSKETIEPYGAVDYKRGGGSHLRTRRGEWVALKRPFSSTPWSALVGALLGPQGERIKTVKREHKCFVKINEETCAGSSDRICIIRGDVPNVISGVGALIRSIAEYRSSESGNTMLLDVLRKRTGDWPYGMNHAATILKAEKRTNNCLEIGIPVKHIGAVIGRKGHVVRDIEFYSLCKVQVGKEATTDCRRLIRITGTEENLDIAKMMVERVVNEYYISNLLSALHASSSQ